VRVALVCAYAWDDPGGVQSHVRELGLRLQDAGHDVVAIAPVRERAREAWVHAAGRPVPLRYNRSSAPIDPRPWSRPRVRAALTAFGPDVVHAHEPLTPSTSMWATLAGVAPVVATFHSGAERSHLFDLAAPALRRVADRIAIRVAVSRAAARFAGSRIGGAYRIVPNGVDVARFAGAEPADLGPGTKVLFVGRLDERKGFRVALDAFARLAPGRPDLRLVVVGDGPERAAADGLPDDVRARVRFLGTVPNAELHPIEAACDLYLGPAVGGESFGIVLVEALAAGLPVIASDIPGYDEVLTDGVDGLLVPPRDAAALAAAAGEVLDDPGRAAALAAAGRARAAAFDWPVVAGQLEALYAEAVAAGPPIR
jgi:phosphatidyl-myo-inositol alpha-mannosyltransferase